MLVVGLLTHNRPEWSTEIVNNLTKWNVPVVVLDNGSHEPVDYTRLGALTIYRNNISIAKAKNELLSRMMNMGADHLILAEDDVIPTCPAAVWQYVTAATITRTPHLNFGWHGTANLDGPVESTQYLDYHKHIVGAWSYYSCDVIESVGLMDEGFYNAWEHVEHTWRIMQEFGGEFYKFPDVRNSHVMFEDKDRDLFNSAIRSNPEWQDNVKQGLEYWRKKGNCPI